FFLELAKVVPAPVRTQTVGMDDERCLRRPRMYRWNRIGGIQAHNAASDRKVELFRTAHNAHLDIADAANRERSLRQIELRQSHDNSASGAAGAAGAAKKVFQRLVEMFLDVVARCVRGMLSQ